ncbi:hypothetical protein DDZ16_00920 [Marinilabilia rubra]|uniref:Uncharacterized protein n=1 Tax=Marinilabilia rubra TaxID=2162893 RepID=A0A2U2BDE0_9BACT|nr:hypothetical protein DDZ16_00920 [Marinilabilia rubra]
MELCGRFFTRKNLTRDFPGCFYLLSYEIYQTFRKQKEILFSPFPDKSSLATEKILCHFT